MVIGDDDLGLLQLRQEVAGHQLARVVVALRVVGLEHPQLRSLMVRPGETTRKPRENLLCGRRTALIVCQAISIAMTVVLPLPVASLSARRASSGLASRLAFARCSMNCLPAFKLGATSVSQIAVSAASTWQKKGRWLVKSWVRQCCRRRAVAGVTCQWLEFGRARQAAASWRSRLMIDVGS